MLITILSFSYTHASLGESVVLFVVCHTSRTTIFEASAQVRTLFCIVFGRSHREDCQRWYTAEYGYVGGRYGRCSEAAMVQALRNGPVSVSFNVYPDFMHYKSGIYHYTGAENLHWKSFIVRLYYLIIRIR